MDYETHQMTLTVRLELKIKPRSLFAWQRESDSECYMRMRDQLTYQFWNVIFLSFIITVSNSDYEVQRHTQCVLHICEQLQSLRNEERL